jgi:2-desacetyl-2-hydroxyethyl bacteriochlorophyllide A dehydrogenase
MVKAEVEMNTTMQALVYEGPRQLNVRQVPLPTLRNDEVLIRVMKVGICGSELSGYLGHNSLRKPPLIMGHEFAGVIERTGSEANRFLIGDRVTANPLVTCDSCRFCRSGQSQLCPKRSLLGAHQPGAFAEYVAVAERNVFKLSHGVSLEEGAFAEPFACALHICRLAQLTPDDCVIIYGAGPIGLFTLQALHVYGVREVVIVDLNEARLEIVAELGGIPMKDAAEAAALQEGGFDVAIDAVGVDVTRQLAIRAVRPGGTVIFTGLHAADSVLPINDAIRSETVMRGAFAYSDRDFASAVQWIEQGRVNLLPWTVIMPLADGGACFEKLLGSPGKIAKILLEMADLDLASNLKGGQQP